MRSDESEPDPGDPAFADLLASFRVARGLSQERLAEITGVSARAVGDLERGTTRRPRRQTVFALANGLGLDAAERDRLVQAARTRSPAHRSPPAPGQTAGDLIGRDRELSGLVQLLHRSAVRMVSVIGRPGVGKSALVTAALELLGFTVAVVRHDTGTEQADPTAANSSSMPRARGTRLLVIDGAETDRIGAERLVALLSHDPGLRLLVTARAPVRLRAEHRWPIDPLDEPASMRLLERKAQKVRPGFVLTDENAARSLVRQLGGNPMAIGLTAVRLRTHTLSEVDAALAVELAGEPDQVLHRVVRSAVGLLPPLDAERLRVLASLGQTTPNELRRALARQRSTSHHLEATIALLAANALITVAGAQVQLAVPSSVREALLSGPDVGLNPITGSGRFQRL